jgi:hypothetical protein
MAVSPAQNQNQDHSEDGLVIQDWAGEGEEEEREETSRKGAKIALIVATEI